MFVRCEFRIGETRVTKFSPLCGRIVSAVGCSASSSSIFTYSTMSLMEEEVGLIRDLGFYCATAEMLCFSDYWNLQSIFLQFYSNDIIVIFV